MDGFGKNDFDKNLDSWRNWTCNANCLTIIKSENGNIFGGYTDDRWSGNLNEIVDDKNAFLFSLINKDNTPLKMKCVGGDNAIFGSQYDLQHYGLISTPDLAICSDSNVNKKCESDLGECYKHPT